MLLSNDMTELETDLAPLLPWLPTLSANRQAAVYSLYFNTSLGNPHRFVGPNGWPHLLEQLQTGEFAAAADNLEHSQPWASEAGSQRVTRLTTFIRNG